MIHDPDSAAILSRRENARTYSAKHYRIHRERIREKRRKKDARVPSGLTDAQYSAIYRKKNPEVRMEQQRRYRARKLNAKIGSFGIIAAWNKIWRSAPEATCFWCLKKAPGYELHADHIEPLARGGAHMIENLCVSCPDCNWKKGAKSMAEWNEKLNQPVLLLV